MHARTDLNRKKRLTAGGCGAARQTQGLQGRPRPGSQKPSHSSGKARVHVSGFPLSRQARRARLGSLGQQMDDVNRPHLHGSSQTSAWPNSWTPAAPPGTEEGPTHCAAGPSRTLFSGFVCSGMRRGLGAWSARLPPPTSAAHGLTGLVWLSALLWVSTSSGWSFATRPSMALLTGQPLSS